jgi:regulator of RNase E activity RraA
MDSDGVVAVPQDRLAEVIATAQRRSEREHAMRPRLVAGELTLDLLAIRPGRGGIDGD